MRIAVTGSTGLIGSQLVATLLADGHEVLRLVRPSSTRPSDGSSILEWDPVAGRLDAAGLAGVESVVHLAGVGIADSRWNDEQKRRILDSRTQGTQLLADTLAAMANPPALLSGSAIGYYGDHGSTAIDETADAGDDFPATVCLAWERAAEAAVQAGVRVVFLRTGIVQSAQGGALAKQLPFFRLGLGGRAGSGKQYLSWISIDDEVAAIRFLLDAEISGPVNLTAPSPVTNGEYTKALGAALHRPTTILPMFGPRLFYGRELADSLLLTSQRVMPQQLLDAGFEFADPTLPDALRSILS